MAENELALENIIKGQGWAEGAASQERVSSLLDRLNGRMAQLALATAEADDDFEDMAA